MAGEEYTAQAASMAARLRDQAARLTETARESTERSAEVSVPVGREGTVSATVTGEGRITGIRFDARALGTPLPELGDAAVRAVSQARAILRDRAAGAGPVPSPEPEAADVTARLAAERVTGTSPDRQVTVTAAGTGEIQSVRIEPDRRDEPDAARLSAAVTAAAGAALEEAARLQRRFTDPLRRDVPDDDLRAITARHAGQMDAIMDRLAAADRVIGDW